MLAWVSQRLETEVNSSTDNPLLDPESAQVLSDGSFSGGYVALAMDSLNAAVASVADLLDRQLASVVDVKYNRGLGPNLVVTYPEGHPEFGLNHGFKGSGRRECPDTVIGSGSVVESASHGQPRVGAAYRPPGLTRLPVGASPWWAGTHSGECR
ncbi:hypothetical protein MSAS_54360 [Mycobacterium saskatchewanense]|uniref:Uncharacterized protein n=1 Tax=Mycobacterium saskatchewanense TaxID=220927 RepID=A0AAJ3TWP6_9MYCO|nr:aromatic amino acid lyase [Mycobacterium saskatchewanense]ORW71059.1 hypothetical protein AWC23_15585 [Mycobacterium saskatchewanense]BBX66262.1 hypothetical protein MSAS_54360 [Mycobacterium saskatchewanense]